MPNPFHAALASAKPEVFWIDHLDGVDRMPGLEGARTADLVIIGGGFTGLWAANLAAGATPGRSVVVLEADHVGFGASSRNGGFLEASLTHGVGNGMAKWPTEMATLQTMATENYEAIIRFVSENRLDVGLEQSGTIHVGTEPWHFEELVEILAALVELDEPSEFLGPAEMKELVHSPTYLGGVKEISGTSIVDPARLVLGLRDVALRNGVSIHDSSPVRGIERLGGVLRVSTDRGHIDAHKVVVATNAYAQPVRAMRRFIVPVYDYVLMSEPLAAQQMSSIGWSGREALADVSNQFHYYRLTQDDRILWGGYDAVYRYGNAIGPEYDQAGDTHAKLASHFFETFPQLEGLEFTHRWAGPIATTSRFTATWGTEHEGDLVWVGGYTGLGVGASRFGAAVALDLVDGVTSERTGLEMVRRKPMPFPPEPLRSAGIQLTRRAIARADRREGRTGPWLRLLGRFGVGFDS